jgi:hypothetical protein
MENWGYKSLEWIHTVREADYKKTKNLSRKELIKETRKAGEDIAKALGLKVVSTEAHSV